jgi:hypothetical protein
MFGYWGWGSSTVELVKSIDEVERQRGFRPPIFVDIRISRSVRAVGFRDDAFEQTLGSRRYRWMRDLGNSSVVDHSKTRRIKIKSPKAAAKLLEFAQDCAKKKRHIIFFCSCELPRTCHRYSVARLLLKAAQRVGTRLEVVEWPGGAPAVAPIDLPVPDEKRAYDMRLPLTSSRPLWKYASLPFGTLGRVVCRGEDEIVPVGPVRFAPTGWYLPVLRSAAGPAVRPTGRAVTAWRRANGYKPVKPARTRSTRARVQNRSSSVNTITTTLKRPWFAQIVDGTKKIEYREIKPYWTERLAAVRTPFKLILRNGMNPPVPQLTLRIDRVVREGRKGEYQLHIGRVLKVEHWDRRLKKPK